MCGVGVTPSPFLSLKKILMRYAILFLLLATATSFSNSKAKSPEIKEEVFVNWSINNKPKDEWTDTDWLAKMMMSEVADSTDIESVRLVGVTAINHTKMLNCTLVEALTKKRAFSGVNNEAYHWWRAEPTSVHKKIAKELVEKGLKKTDPNVFAFCNLKIIDPMVRDWFLKFKIYKEIGGVTFFLYEKK
jgi:hypothetical protein